METYLLIILIFILGIDVLTNIFMILLSPKWEKIKRREAKLMKETIDTVREQNVELKQYIQDCLQGS